MKRKTLALLVWCGAGLALAVGCSADLRNLNGCRAVTSAVCERSRECDPQGFDATFASLDVCVDKFIDVLGKGPIPTGNDKCGKFTVDCLDEIEVAACGRTTKLANCGIVRSISPGKSGSSPAKDPVEGGVTKPGAGDGGSEALTSGMPDILELRQGVLVACKAGQGCASSAGNTYGQRDAELKSFAVDSQRNVYGVDANRRAVMISPSGTRTEIGGPWDRAFSVPMAGGQVGAAFSREEKALFVLAPGQTKTEEATIDIEGGAASVRGIARVGPSYAVDLGGQIYLCSSLNSCSLSLSLSSSIGIRGAEGTNGGVQFVGVDQGKAIASDGKIKIPMLEECSGEVVAHDLSIACITSSRAIRIDKQTVAGATDVAKIALGPSDIYWVTSSGAYYRASTALPASNDK